MRIAAWASRVRARTCVVWLLEGLFINPDRLLYGRQSTRARGGAWTVDNFRHRFLLVFVGFVSPVTTSPRGKSISAALVKRKTKKPLRREAGRAEIDIKKWRFDLRCAIAAKTVVLPRLAHC